MPTLINLRVTPDTLERQAQTVSEAIAEMQRSLTKMDKIFNETKNYWLGEASNVYQEKYAGQMETTRNVLKELENYPDMLLEMAGIYRNVEIQNIQCAEDLQANIIP